MEASLTLRTLLLGFAATAMAELGVARARRNVGESDGPPGTPASVAPGQRRGKVAGPPTDLDPAGRVTGRCWEDPIPPGLAEIQELALEEAPGRPWSPAQAPAEALRSGREGRGRERIETEAEPRGRGEV